MCVKMVVYVNRKRWFSVLVTPRMICRGSRTMMRLDIYNTGRVDCCLAYVSLSLPFFTLVVGGASLGCVNEKECGKGDSGH